MDAQRDPSMLANVRRAKKSRIIEEDAVQQFPHFQANAELTFVFFHHKKYFLVHAKGGMPEAKPFLSSRQARAYRPQPLPDLFF